MIISALLANNISSVKIFFEKTLMKSVTFSFLYKTYH